MDSKEIDRDAWSSEDLEDLIDKEDEQLKILQEEAQHADEGEGDWVEDAQEQKIGKRRSGKHIDKSQAKVYDIRDKKRPSSRRIVQQFSQPSVNAEPIAIKPSFQSKKALGDLFSELDGITDDTVGKKRKRKRRETKSRKSRASKESKRKEEKEDISHKLSSDVISSPLSSSSPRKPIEEDEDEEELDIMNLHSLETPASPLPSFSSPMGFSPLQTGGTQPPSHSPPRSPTLGGPTYSRSPPASPQSPRSISRIPGSSSAVTSSTSSVPPVVAKNKNLVYMYFTHTHYEEFKYPDRLFMYGKVLTLPFEKGKPPLSTQSCVVGIKNMSRVAWILPNESYSLKELLQDERVKANVSRAFPSKNPQTSSSSSQVSSQSSQVSSQSSQQTSGDANASDAKDKDASSSKDSIVSSSRISIPLSMLSEEQRTQFQHLMRDVRSHLKIPKASLRYSLQICKYVSSDPTVDRSPQVWLCVEYPASVSSSALPSSSRTYSHCFGSSISPLDWFMVKKGIKGPGWMCIACPPTQDLSNFFSYSFDRKHKYG
ncbi:hypothetical protein ADUPG1_006549, partial [Aduncisulcus paluster]